jgi:hypothetical protein
LCNETTNSVTSNRDRTSIGLRALVGPTMLKLTSCTLTGTVPLAV